MDGAVADMAGRGWQEIWLWMTGDRSGEIVRHRELLENHLTSGGDQKFRQVMDR